MSDKKKTIEVPYFCDMLIDQNRYIGEDPIGHACSQPAEVEIEGVLFCKRCEGLLLTAPDRLTFNKECSGKEWQDKNRERMIKGLLPITGKKEKRKKEINEERKKEMWEFFKSYSPFEILESYTYYISDQIYKTEIENNKELGKGISNYSFDELQVLLDELVSVEIENGAIEQRFVSGSSNTEETDE